MQPRWYVAALALVAACSESAPPPTSPRLPPELQDQPEPRVFWARGLGPALPRGSITWHGGDVIVASKTFAIYWGPDWMNATFVGDKITGMTSFLQGWSNSTYAGALTEYGGLNGQVTAASTYLGSVIDPSTPDISPLSVIAEVAKVVDVPDPAALYLVFVTTPATASLGFCGAHTWWHDKRHPVQVAVILNLDGVAGCDPHDTFTAHSQGLAALANVTAHELAETITDPRNLGWYAVGGRGEIGDKCAFTFSPSIPTVTFTNGSMWHVQGEWSNKAFTGGTGFPSAIDGESGCVWS